MLFFGYERMISANQAGKNRIIVDGFLKRIPRTVFGLFFLVNPRFTVSAHIFNLAIWSVWLAYVLLTCSDPFARSHNGGMAIVGAYYLGWLIENKYKYPADPEKYFMRSRKLEHEK